MADTFTIDPPAPTKPALTIEPPATEKSAPAAPDLRPAVRHPGGFVVEAPKGFSHDDLGKPPEQARGFVDQSGTFLDRRQAAQASGVPTTEEPGKLHSEDQRRSAWTDFTQGLKAKVDQFVRQSVTDPLKDSATGARKDIESIYKSLSEYSDHDKDILQRFTSLGWAGLTAVDFALAGPVVRAFLKSYVGKPLESATGGALNAEKTAEDLSQLAYLGVPTAAASKAVAGSGAARVAEEILSPTTVNADAGKAEANIRAGLGQAERATAAATEALSRDQKLVNARMPAFEKDLADYKAGRAPAQPSSLSQFLSYVEGRTTAGVKLADPELQPLADEVKTAMEQRLAKFRSLPSTAQAGFREDYFPHMWKDEKSARNWLAGRQGSGRNLRAREIPTIEEGLKAGLELAEPSPVVAAKKYVANMDHYLAWNEITDEARRAGDIKYFARGSQPAGWVPIQGRLAEKVVQFDSKEGKHQAVPRQAYAPSGYARVYNNAISRGFADLGEEWGQAYEGAQRVASGIVAAKLGLSAFHATTMANEAIISEVAKGIGQAARGDVLSAAKSIAAAPAAPVTSIMQGAKLRAQYLGTKDYGPATAKMADLLATANGRVMRRDPTMYGSRQGDYITAARQGILKQQMRESLAKALTLKGVMPETLNQAGRLLDTIAHPLFDVAIPRLKAGAFGSTMGDWLAAHPNATRAEEEAAARTVWDSIDNRFGELVQDNLFWNKMGKQVAQVMTLSPTWNIGTIREIGGGVADLGRTRKLPGGGVELTERTKYAVALPITTAFIASVLQFLKTGEAPDSTTLKGDYKTGGVVNGVPERAQVPGYIKDVKGWLADPFQEASNKLNPAVQLFSQLATNRDWRGLPIAPPFDVPEAYPGERVARYGAALAEGVTPIFIEQAFLDPLKGSNISLPERLLAIRPAPRREQAPEQVQAQTRKRDLDLWRKKLRADARERARRQSSAEEEK